MERPEDDDENGPPSEEELNEDEKRWKEAPSRNHFTPDGEPMNPTNYNWDHWTEVGDFWIYWRNVPSTGLVNPKGRNRGRGPDVYQLQHWRESRPSFDGYFYDVYRDQYFHGRKKYRDPDEDNLLYDQMCEKPWRHDS